MACDESGKDPSRLCFISHDPDIRVNRNAIVLPIERFQFGPNGAGQALPTPPWPADSILEDLIVYARGFSEADDTILIGSLLPIIPGVLARKVHCWLDGAVSKLARARSRALGAQQIDFNQTHQVNCRRIAGR